MITDTSKFVGLLFVNSDTDDGFQEEVINQQEAELLPKWFGYELAKDLLSDTPSTEAQKLIDGFEHSNDAGELQKLTGLAAFLPYIMYFYIVRDEQSNNTSLGQQEALAENSTKADPTAKLCQNYNKGVRYVNDMIEYLYEHSTDYTTAVLDGYEETINLFGI